MVTRTEDMPSLSSGDCILSKSLRCALATGSHPESGKPDGCVESVRQVSMLKAFRCLFSPVLLRWSICTPDSSPRNQQLSWCIGFCQISSQRSARSLCRQNTRKTAGLKELAPFAGVTTIVRAVSQFRQRLRTAVYYGSSAAFDHDDEKSRMSPGECRAPLRCIKIGISVLVWTSIHL